MSIREIPVGRKAGPERGPQGATRQPGKAAPAAPADAFVEAGAWRGVGPGWQPLFGRFYGLGMSFEWHDFECADDLDWARSFHPGSVEVCLNLAGQGRVADGAREVRFGPMTAGFYRRGAAPLCGVRPAGQRHRFLTVEMGFEFLRRHLGPFAPSLHPLVGSVVSGQDETSAVAPATRLSSRQQQLLSSLRTPPVLAVAQALWYESKALELAAELFFQAPDRAEMFCHRQQRVATDRVEKLITLLRQDLSAPPSLEDLGRAIGCSPFHLSRTFSAVTGLTLPQYLRQLRLERAAELLRSGRFNVTEAALEVGYSSLSHFTIAFRETFGCCPGLYPLKTPAPGRAGDARAP